MLRDADEPKDFGGASDGDLETRIYYCQNWRSDVVATIGPQDDATGDGLQVLERLKYDSYGRPRLFQIADFNHNASYTSGSSTAGTDDYDFTHASSPATDINFDGADDIDDSLTYSAATNYQLTYSRKLYAGYEWDPALREGTSGAGMYHVRHRVLLSELGRWGRRDPVGYVDGASLFGYGAQQEMPLAELDPNGLTCCGKLPIAGTWHPPIDDGGGGIIVPGYWEDPVCGIDPRAILPHTDEFCRLDPKMRRKWCLVAASVSADRIGVIGPCSAKYEAEFMRACQNDVGCDAVGPDLKPAIQRGLAAFYHCSGTYPASCTHHPRPWYECFGDCLVGLYAQSPYGVCPTSVSSLIRGCIRDCVPPKADCTKKCLRRVIPAECFAWLIGGVPGCLINCGLEPTRIY